MSKLRTNMIDKTDTEMKFEVLINEKVQRGAIVGVRATPEEIAKDPKTKFTSWKIENDKFSNRKFNTDLEAIVALCEITGKKLNLDKIRR